MHYVSMVKFTDLAQMDKLTFLTRLKSLSTFIAKWKSFMEFLHKNKKNELLTFASVS